nr:hypothetical protein [Tanacetum cinerariifolium]
MLRHENFHYRAISTKLQIQSLFQATCRPGCYCTTVAETELGERAKTEADDSVAEERHEKAFYIGLTKFVDDCKPLVNSVRNIKCPCKSCRTVLWVSIENLPKHITRYGWDPGYKKWVHHGEPGLPPPPLVIDITRQPQMSDMIALLNDLSYIPPNNEQNEPTQGDISETSNEPTQAKRNVFEELYSSANKEGDNNKDVHFCPVCKTSRWKDSNIPGKKVPKKELCYFPNIPRLQRLYKSSHTAKEMTWHATGNCTEPGKMEHPLNGRAWKNFDTNMWPVILTTYNLPLWLCMKESSFMMMLLIPGPKSPGKDIDVYLRPLINDLKVLWALKGVEIIDVATGQKFNVRAMVLWNINDFTARSKTAYVGHKIFLKKPHKWRRSLEFNEALEGGPIRPRWMFPFERFMKKLKGYVRNKAKSKSSIAEGYVAEEALIFSSHYFRDVTTKFNQLKKVIWYVLHNSPEIDMYRSQFKSKFPNKDMKEEFPNWFGSQIRQRHVGNDPGVSATGKLFALACGPTATPISVNSCVVNVVSLNDLDNATLHIDGESTEVDAPPNIIDLDEDGDISDDEDAISHDLADSDDEDLVNVDDYDGVEVVYSNVSGCGMGPPRQRQPKTQFKWKESGQAAYPLGDPKPQRWTYINAGIQQHLQKLYNTNKASLKAAHWVINPETGMNQARAAQNRQNQAKSTIVCRQGSRSLARLRDQMMEISSTREYSSLIHTFFVTHNVGGVFVRDEDRALYDEMLRLQPLGFNTETGVPYTEEEIMAIVRKGKQRGNLPGVGRVLSGRATGGCPPPPQSTIDLADVEKLKKTGSGCGDDEPDDDEDDDEDEEDGDILMYLDRVYIVFIQVDPILVVLGFFGHGYWWVCLLLYGVIMNRGFLDSRERKYNNRKKTNVVAGTGSFTKSGGTLNDDNPPKEAVASFVSDEPVAMEMQSPVVDKSYVVDSDVGSYPPLPTQGTTSAGNTPGKATYANVTGKLSGKKWNFRTLFTPGGNSIDVVVSVESIRTIGDRFANSAYGFFLGNQVAYPVVANYVKNTWCKYELVRSMFSSSTGLFSFQFSFIEGLDVMLENGPCDDGLSVIATKLGTPLMLDSYTADNVVVAMPRIREEGHYTCNVRVEYEWEPPRCSSCKVFGHIHEECPKNKGAGEKKTVNKPSQTSRVDNDVEFGTNGGTTNLVNNGATSSGSSFMNTDNDGEFASNTPIVPMGIVESDSEVEVVFDETVNLRILTSGKDESDKGYDTNSLLEQWRDSYPDNNDYDPYDDDMYENHDLSEYPQSICDDFDITVRGRKKK